MLVSSYLLFVYKKLPTDTPKLFQLYPGQPNWPSAQPVNVY